MILTVPTGLQRRSILEANARINIWGGAVRSGKTIASIIRWLEFVARGPQGDLLMAGKTERTLKRNILDPISDIIGPDQCRVNWGMGEARILGRRVYIVGANDLRSEEKLRGLTLAGAYGDEVTTWVSEFFGMLLSRLSIAGAKLFCTTNPDSPSHWLKRDWIDREHELNLKYFHFKIDDNPALDPGIVADLKREYVGVWYQRYIEGIWAQFVGAIYDEWEPRRHVVNELPPLIRAWGAIDYGRYNPFVAQIQGLGEDGRVYVAREWSYDGRQRKRQKSEAEYVQDLIVWLKGPEVRPVLGEELPEWWYIDPSAISFLSAMYQAEIPGVTPADNDVKSGLQLVASAISKIEDRLRVHHSCKRLCDEFPTYSWDPKAADRGIEQPLKRDDHCLVAGTLVETSEGSLPIEGVKVGDLVATRQGWKPVIDSWQVSPAADVMTLRMSDGSELTATPNHRVWVEDQGWKRLDALRYGDKLLPWRDRSKSLCSVGSGSVGIRTLQDSLNNATSCRESPIANAAWVGCMRKSGRRQTGLSPTAAISTISMATPSTTRSRTWSRWMQKSMRGFIRPSVIGGRQHFWPGSRKSDHSQPRGMARKMAACGIASTEGLRGLPGSRGPAYATNAEPNSNRSACASTTASVATHANPVGGERQVSTMRRGPVQVAASLSKPIVSSRRSAAPVSVLAVIGEGQRQAVFDLTVQDAHEFFANGVLVHNSLDACRYGLQGSRFIWRGEPLSDAA